MNEILEATETINAGPKAQGLEQGGKGGEGEKQENKEHPTMSHHLITMIKPWHELLVIKYIVISVWEILFVFSILGTSQKPSACYVSD